MDAKVGKYLREIPADKRKLMLTIRAIFLGTSKKIEETIKWGNLMFMCNGYLAMVYTFKKTDYINVGFIKAVRLNDPKKLFAGTGKGMRHIKVYSEKDIPKGQLRKWIKEAMSLNEGK